MITVQDIYNATNEGLNIILYFYPQAAGVIDKGNKAFATRESDKTPSTYIKKIKGVWRLTDFGESDESKTPIDIIMSELNLKFNEAIYWAANEFGVTGDVINKEKNVAKIERREATDSEPEGYFTFKQKDFTEKELKLLGPKVKQIHCENLNWMSLEFYQRTKVDDKSGKLMTTTIKSTDNYPIFMRKCVFEDSTGKLAHFYKIYQPLNPDKAFRFFYEGQKPQKYINGLHELKSFFTAYNNQQQTEFLAQNPEGVYKQKKLPEAFICSGERDALCIEAMRFSPLWFNSETYNLSDSEFYEIMKYVERVYNIPDIDETGISRGRILATKYIDIYTVWLPAKLRTYYDNRRRPRKDLRDFVEIWPDKKDFDNQVTMAMPVRFWEYTIDKGKKRLEVNTDFMFNFLSTNGFYSIEDKNSKTGRMFIQVIDNVVYKTTAQEVQAFIKKFARERFLNIDIRNLINNSTRFSENTLAGLDKVTLDFTDFTPNSQFFFFPNTAFEVTANNVIEHKPKDVKLYVWEEEVIPHNVKRIEPAFKIVKDEDGEYDIEINHLSSNFLKVLINTSRMFWRKEFEEQFKNDLDSEEAQQYRLKHQFDISGPYLNDLEKEEQKQHLINKIFALGYLLHRHKSEHRAWCVFAMDNKIAEGDDSNGGSGKSVVLKTPRFFMNSTTISGRNPRVTENAHIYENVSEHTDYILIDDSDKYLPFGFFFDSVTGEITVNPKFSRSYTIPFEKAGKFAITSNFTLDRFDPSTERRILYMVFSDYYHQKTADNDYLETRTIFDDFQKDLFRHKYDENDWNADINLMVDCCQFYLSTLDDSVKIQPPMANVTARNLRAVMTDMFLEWAQVYFCEQSENCNRAISKSKALNDFVTDTKQNKWTMNKFTKALRSFCKYSEYIIKLNPEELCNSGSRIIQKIDGKSTEMIYIQTKETLNYLEDEPSMPETGTKEPEPRSTLPF